MELLEDLISTCYAAQKRTSRYRQFVFYKGDKVYKGPYIKEKMDIILARSEILKKWNTPLIVHPVGVLENFLIYDNISKDYEIVDYDINEESFSNYSYKVAKRTIVDKMNNVLLDNPWIYDSIDLLEAMVHLWILGVGDIGMFNILIDVEKRLIYVIDYDECNDNERFDEYFYFSKHPAKKFKWYERTKKHYRVVAERLERLDNTSRVKKAISLLREYGEGELSIGKMEWHGLFGGTLTYSGYKLDEVKSGLQKYIRRGVVDKAIMCTIELYRLNEVTDSTQPITNLYNRVKIIAVEDVSLAGFSTVIDVLKLVNEGDRDPNTLISMVECLAKCKKTRICSHVNATFCNSDGRKYAKSIGIVIDGKGLNKGYIKKYITKYPFCDIEDLELAQYAIMMYKRITEGDFNAFVWYDRFRQGINKKGKLRYAYYGKKTTDPIVYIFEVLELLCDKNIIEEVRKSYFTLNSNKVGERNCFIIFAILSVIYELKYETCELTSTYNLDDIINGNYSLVLDEYVYDKHTAKGAHKGRSTFVIEGAHVENEDMKYHIDELVDVYVNYLD